LRLKRWYLWDLAVSSNNILQKTALPPHFDQYMPETLHRTAKDGRAAEITHLVNGNIGIKNRDAKDQSALHIKRPHRLSKPYTRTNTARPVTQTVNPTTARLRYTSPPPSSVNAAVYRLLPDRGTDVNAQDTNSQTPLPPSPPSMPGAWLEIVDNLIAISGASWQIQATASGYVDVSQDPVRLIRVHPERAEWMQVTYDGKTGNPSHILGVAFQALYAALPGMNSVDWRYLMLEADVADAVADDEDRIMLYSALYRYWFRARRAGMQELVIELRLSIVSTVGGHEKKERPCRAPNYAPMIE